MKLRRIFRLGLALLALVLAIVAGMAGWIYATESGARFAITRVIEASGGALAIGMIDGRLRDELVLADIRYRDTRVEVDIEQLSLRLGLASILARMLVIEDLSSTTVRVRWLGTAGGNAPAAGGAFRLPLTLRLDRATIAGLAVERESGRLDLERITVSGVVEASDARISRLELRTLGLFLSLQGDVSWEAGLVLDGLASWEGRFRDEQWRGSVAFSGGWPALEIEQEMLEPFAQTARGRVLIDATPNGDLTIDWPGLGEFALTTEFDPAALVLRGRVEGENLVPAALVPGWPGELALRAGITASFDETFRIETDDLQAEASLGDDRVALDFAGAFTWPDQLAIERLVAVQGQNRVDLAGSMGNSLDLAATAVLDDLAGLAALAAREELAGFGIAGWLPAGLSGRATADVAVAGPLQSPEVAGSLSLAESAFAGLPLALDAEFAWSAPETPELRIGRFEAVLGASRLSAGGVLTGIARPAGGGLEADVDLSVRAELDDLAELALLADRDEVRAVLGRELALAGLSGSAEAELQIGGTLREPEIDLDLRAGNPAYASVSLTEASLTARGRIDASGWDGTLDALRLAESRFGAWTLAAPVSLRLGPQRIEIPETCLVQADSSVCGEWRYPEGDGTLRLAAADLDLALLQPFLPDNLALAGRLRLDASLDALTTRPQGRLAARGADIGIAFGTSESDRVATTLESVSIDATLDDPVLRVDAIVEGLAGGRAALSLGSTDIYDENGLISGQFDIDWPDLSGLALLSPDVGEVAGRLTLAIDVGGTMAEPLLGGSAALIDGRITVPQWGLIVERIEGSAESSDGENLNFSGRGFIDERELSLDGVTRLDPAANWPTEFNVRGDRLNVARRPDALVVASPDLVVTVDLPRIDVTGYVLVPEAEISVVNLPAQAVRVSPDAVVHGQVAVEPNRPLTVSADLTLELGDAVRYQGANLNTDLSGSLRLEYQSGLSPEARGNIRMEGAYDAYGQSLVLERGELLFAGPLDNPALDVLAVRRIGARPGVEADTVVGIRLSGTLQAPVPSVYSDPPMSEANALAYLRFGRPLTATDDTETATIESMALTLGLQQALPAVQRVGESIGLDELTIATTDLDAGSLMAGKYVSAKVYMSYTYGLFNRLGGFLLRYQINDRFSLETRSGDDKSMDLLYSVEKE